VRFVTLKTFLHLLSSLDSPLFEIILPVHFDE